MKFSSRSKNILAVSTTILGTSYGLLTGSANVTPNDYGALGSALATNPPSCEIPYGDLDITRITGKLKL